MRSSVECKAPVFEDIQRDRVASTDNMGAEQRDPLHCMGRLKSRGRELHGGVAIPHLNLHEYVGVCQGEGHPRPKQQHIIRSEGVREHSLIKD